MLFSLTELEKNTKNWPLKIKSNYTGPNELSLCRNAIGRCNKSKFSTRKSKSREKWRVKRVKKKRSDFVSSSCLSTKLGFVRSNFVCFHWRSLEMTIMKGALCQHSNIVFDDDTFECHTVSVFNHHSCPSPGHLNRQINELELFRLNNENPNRSFFVMSLLLFCVITEIYTNLSVTFLWKLITEAVKSSYNLKNVWIT